MKCHQPERNACAWTDDCLAARGEAKWHAAALRSLVALVAAAVGMLELAAGNKYDEIFVGNSFNCHHLKDFRGAIQSKKPLN